MQCKHGKDCKKCDDMKGMNKKKVPLTVIAITSKDKKVTRKVKSKKKEG